MKCPICGGAELVHETRDVPYEYKGHKTTLKNITAQHCSACGEGVMDRDETTAYAAAVKAFQRKVNATLIDPAFIASVRKRLNIDQREAGELFGGGVNAFSRYETGKTSPPVTIIKLFKMFDKHPELFEEYRSL